MYSLVTKSPLDREKQSQYDLTITAKDAGQPPLSSEKTISVAVSDVNDNSPEFSLSPYTFYVTEANEPGTSVFSVKAFDHDENDNAHISYHILRDGSEDNKLTSFLNINSENGDILALKSFDFETLKTFHFHIVASDSGTPSLSSNVTVNVFILDRNDNAPVILYPLSSNGSAEGVEEIPRNVNAGHLVTKVRAYDADIGYNGWLLFSLQEVTDHSLFGLDRYTGQIRTLRSFTETDEAEHKLVILVKDNGNVSLSYRIVGIKERGEDRKMPFLILQKQLDREAKREHKLLLSAIDGGRPARSGTIEILIEVLDVNDNTPVFTQDVYSATLNENAAPGTLIIQVNATDLDESTNSEIVYSFGKEVDVNVQKLFNIDSETGEIIVMGVIDFEEKKSYDIDIQASDKGPVPLSTDRTVVIKVIDLNDNSPEIEVTSFSKSVPEDSRTGTTVALISVNDLDSGLNGKVSCFIRENVPFGISPSLQDNMFAIVTKSPLDREENSFYELSIVAKDTGEPPLSSEKTISVVVSDVNDNRPQFSLSPYTFYVTENNDLTAPVFSVRASDLDESDNAHISYHIPRDSSGDSIGLFLNINSESGAIMALKSFDFETLKTFQFQVSASDSGTPSLSSNVTVNVFILDQNDNAPVILYPVSSNGSAEGQIRTLRSFTETDEAEHKLVILVKDNGNVSLSATATVIVKLVEPKEAFAASDVKSSAKADEDNNVTFYLMITLGSVSALFLISIIVLIAMQCSKSTDYTSKYLQETNYDGTLCHSIQYRSGDKRYMLVGPRMSIGSTIVPGSHANTLVLPDRRRTSEEVG
uniref:Protocadherin 2 alpha a 15 n=1 Tax=Seriola dumerili TaxID=41447 RepID=A0A3B4UZL8_SERDU